MTSGNERPSKKRNKKIQSGKVYCVENSEDFANAGKKQKKSLVEAGQRKAEEPTVNPRKDGSPILILKWSPYWMDEELPEKNESKYCSTVFSSNNIFYSDKRCCEPYSDSWRSGMWKIWIYFSF